jgi:hypothetical protein
MDRSRQPGDEAEEVEEEATTKKAREKKITNTPKK